jgi:hypothetical protein
MKNRNPVIGALRQRLNDHNSTWMRAKLTLIRGKSTRDSQNAQRGSRIHSQNKGDAVGEYIFPR